VFNPLQKKAVQKRRVLSSLTSTSSLAVAVPLFCFPSLLKRLRRTMRKSFCHGCATGGQLPVDLAVRMNAISRFREHVLQCDNCHIQSKLR